MKNNYNWEIELKDGTIVNKGNNFNSDNVVRISFIPISELLPRHDILTIGFKFKKRFSRSFMNMVAQLKERLHCVVTDRFRVYVRSSTGQCIITDKDYELYL